MTQITVKVPGKFWGFLSGSGPGQGLPDSESGYVGGEELFRAIQAAKSVRVGAAGGYYLAVVLDGPQALDALNVLDEYADVCLTANSDEPDHAEVAAARTVKKRCAEARLKFVRAEADRLRDAWRVAQARKESEEDGSEWAYWLAQEETAWESHVDWIDLHGLTFTEWDPRGPDTLAVVDV